MIVTTVEKDDAETTEQQRDEVLVLLELLNQEIVAADRSKRRLERDLDMGQGYIGSILRGRITLKVQHVWDLGDAVGFEPLVLFFNSAPKEHQDRFLAEMRLSRAAPDQAALALDTIPREELEELVRKLVRQELARMALS